MTDDKEKNLTKEMAKESKSFKKLKKYVLDRILSEMNEKETKGFKKLNNYFVEIVKSEFFQNRISELRKKHNITVGDKDKCYKYPPFTPPEEVIGVENAKKHIELLKEVKDLSNELGLYTYDWCEIVWNYLFWGRLAIERHTLLYNYDLCKIRDALGDLEMEKDPDNGFAYKALTDGENQEYPIAVIISPYASQRDIVDFIKKRYFIIKKYQQKYRNKKIKIGSVKTKNPKKQKRNQFIYDNRHLSLEETKKLVEEKFGESLPYEYIGKIRSTEGKRRKEL